jgi:hypothetical protein
VQYRTNPQNRFQVLPAGQRLANAHRRFLCVHAPSCAVLTLRYNRARAGIGKRWSAQGNETGRKALCTKLCTTDCAIVTKHALGGFSSKGKAR